MYTLAGKWFSSGPKTEYSLLRKEDGTYLEENDTQEYLLPERPNLWVPISVALHWMVTFTLAALVIVLVARRPGKDPAIGSFASGWATDFVSAHAAIDAQQVRFTGSPSFFDNKTIYIPNPDPTRYVGDPSPEIDKNWDTLTWGRYILITGEEAHASWGPDIDQYWDSQRGGYVAGLDMFHTLHCLNNMRKTLYPEYYGQMEMDHNHILHQSHCIEQLRQYIMCSGDMTPIPTRYYPALGRNYVNSDVRHTCRNFEQLRLWMVDRYEGSSAVKPAATTE